jgi:glycolate oxidase FAD binding subunit
MTVVAVCSTQEAAELLREDDRPVLVRGAGTKRQWGSPPKQVGLTVQTKGLNGIVEHTAGDLIVVVRAGTPMAQLEAELAHAGQQLALDSPFPGATVGGSVAANTSGPRRLLYGTVRDLLIGITIVRPDGVVARAGGKVVKNVAG